MTRADHPNRRPVQSSDRLTQALRTGHFKDALKLLRRRTDRRRDPDLEALLSELELRVGEVDQASRRAGRLLEHPGVGLSSQARCHLVLGTISRDTGHLDEALRHYDRAEALARADGSLEQLCLAQMRLLTLQVSGYEPAEASEVLSTLRRNVQKAGDPLLAIAFHICRAEIETRNGQIEVAQSQLTSARGLLKHTPNVFLEGNAAIAGLCLALIRSEWAEAIEQGRFALKCAGTSGNVRTALAARLNLGQVLLSQGRGREAEQHLNQALLICPQGGNSEIGLLDARAQACLVRGDTQQCEALLGKIDRLLTTHEQPSAYNRYWGLRTRLSLLERLGRWHEAARLVAEVGATIPSPTDSSLRVHLTLAKADIYLAVGRLEEAHEIMNDLTSRLETMGLEHQGQLERLWALYSVRQCPAESPSHFERAARLLLRARNRTSYIKVLEEYSAFLETWSSNQALEEWQDDARSTSTSKILVERLAALQRFSRDPPLSGVEAFWLFVECGEALNVALVKGDARHQSTVLSLPAHSEWYDALPPARALAIELGSEPRWTLYLQPKDQRSLSSTCSALVTLVRSCAATHPPGAGRTPPSADAEPTQSSAVLVSDVMKDIVTNVGKVASTTLPILITGDTGTGKEVLARLIHQQSRFATMPFVAFNCATVPKDLLDSQLFGHRRGAFTGAHQDFQGVVRSAEGGTLFLDEIGDLSRESQPKLLRFLESGEIHPLGEPRPITADVRIIAATNARLDALVLDGHFRQDLLYRLNAVRYRLPPLRERREEIPALVDHFLAIYSEEFQKGHVRVADETLDYLLLYSWPGNVRQLSNEIRRAVATSDPNEVLGPDRLSPEIAPGWQARETSPALPSSAGLVLKLDQPLSSATAKLERAMLEHALRATNGKIDAAARRLGLSRKGLYLKRQRFASDAKDASNP